MRLGLRTFTRAATALLLAGTAASLTVAPAAAQSHGGFHGGGGGGFHGGGGGGFHGGGGYGGYRGGYGGFRGGYGGFRGGYYGGFGYGYGCCGYYGGFGFGDALLGAALIGGTAAVIASDAPTYYETYPAPVYPAYAPPPAAYGYAPPPPAAPQPGYPPQGYQSQQAYQSTDPVDQCSRAAINETASRGDSGRVTKIDRVDGHPNGARVTGTIEVRRTSHNGEVENARFTCTADYGQVTFFRFG